MAVPFAVFGALLAVWLRGLSNDLYLQIGLITLVGLAAKNAILIVEFAVLSRQRGRTIVEAAEEAAQLRFRPIVMTSLAFILGVVPLAISTGAGAASRHSIGTRSEEHTSELQSLMRISYAVFCLKQKTTTHKIQ